MLALQQRVEVQLHRELDRFTRGARGCDDDDAACRWLRGREGFAIGRKIVIANVTQFAQLPRPVSRIRLTRRSLRFLHAGARRRRGALLAVLRGGRSRTRGAPLLLVVLPLRLDALPLLLLAQLRRALAVLLLSLLLRALRLIIA